VGAGVRTQRFRIGVRASYFAWRDATLAEPAGVGARIQLWVAALEGGLAFRFSTIEVPILGGFESGALRASGLHVSDGVTARRPWFGATLGSGLGLLLRGMFCLTLRADAILALSRPRFAVRGGLDEHVVHRPAQLGARAYLELEVRFL
jgi:hypothetical protein